jgi:glutamate synthase domain-containing protein 3
MTAGSVVILGGHGLNLGAGMTGGQVFVHDPEDRLAPRLNDQLVLAHRPDAAALAELHALLERHVRFTGSRVAADLLKRWDEEAPSFMRIAPKAEVAALQQAFEGTVSGAP